MVLALSSLGACSIVSARTDPPQAVTMKADRRAVISETRPAAPTKKDISPAHQVTCAEPSPDAISALAESLSASASIPIQDKTVQASFAQAAGTSMGYVGMRTATIQAIRDLGFRACEAYMNGALDHDDYQSVLHGAAPIILGMEAIDALAGPPPVPPLILAPPGTQANGSNAAPSGQVTAGTLPSITVNQGTRDANSWSVIANAVHDIVCYTVAHRDHDGNIVPVQNFPVCARSAMAAVARK